MHRCPFPEFVNLHVDCDEASNTASLLDISMWVLDKGKKRATEAMRNVLAPHLKRAVVRVRRGSGPRKMFAPRSVCKQVALLLLASAQMSTKSKRMKIERMGLLNEARVIPSPIETKTIYILMHAFIDQDPRLSFVVGEYCVSLYLAHQKIVIECAEIDHTVYDSSTERTRTNEITKHLQCLWFRYNPFDTNFCVGTLIHTILQSFR